MKLNKFISYVAMVTILTPSFASADDLARGKELYNGVGACFSCHGTEGKGDGAAAAALNPKPVSFASGAFKYDTDKDGKTGTEADIANVIGQGAMAFGGSPLMAARSDISEADRHALAKYVLSLKK